jgi:hypothetical protein
MKYEILRNYGTEGFKFDDPEFDTVDEAIKHAVASNFCTPFYIVSVHWKPEITKIIKNK